MPRESFDAPENLPEEAPCQVAFGQLQDEVPSMPDQATTGLDDPPLEAHRGPALDDSRQDEPAQEMGESVDAKPPLGENSDMPTTSMMSLTRTASRAEA